MNQQSFMRGELPVRNSLRFLILQYLYGKKPRTLYSLRIRSTYMSKCSSPIPEMIVWLGNSLSVREAKNVRIQKN